MDMLWQNPPHLLTAEANFERCTPTPPTLQYNCIKMLFLKSNFITCYQFCHLWYAFISPVRSSFKPKFQPEFLKTCFPYKENTYCIFANKLPPSFKDLF